MWSILPGKKIVFADSQGNIQDHNILVPGTRRVVKITSPICKRLFNLLAPAKLIDV